MDLTWAIILIVVPCVLMLIFWEKEDFLSQLSYLIGDYKERIAEILGYTVLIAFAIGVIIGIFSIFKEQKTWIAIILSLMVAGIGMSIWEYVMGIPYLLVKFVCSILQLLFRNIWTFLFIAATVVVIVLYTI